MGGVGAWSFPTVLDRWLLSGPACDACGAEEEGCLWERMEAMGEGSAGCMAAGLRSASAVPWCRVYNLPRPCRMPVCVIE